MINISDIFNAIVLFIIYIIFRKLFDIKSAIALIVLSLSIFVANSIYPLSDANSLYSILINPAAGLIFLTFVYFVWYFISKYLGLEYIPPAPSSGLPDGGFGGGGWSGSHRRRGIRVEDLKPNLLFFMFLFSAISAGVLFLVIWILGYGSSLNPLVFIGLSLDIFSIFLSIPFLYFYLILRGHEDSDSRIKRMMQKNKQHKRKG